MDINAKIKKVAGVFEGQGAFTILLSDYNVQIPTYMGVKVADKVEVTVDFKSH